MCLFAEDIGLRDKYFFARLLDECTTPAQAYDLIGGLFVEMYTPGKTSGGRFNGVDYFNGGLFREPARIELDSTEINLLKNAAHSDWSKVRPEIFGAIFEHSLGKETRHAYGAKTLKRLDELHVTENALPLDNLDANFVIGEAIVAPGLPPFIPIRCGS
jgi:hypothetical protein